MLALIVAVVGALAPLLVGAVYTAAGSSTAALWELAPGRLVAAGAVARAQAVVDR